MIPGPGRAPEETDRSCRGEQGRSPPSRDSNHDRRGPTRKAAVQARRSLIDLEAGARSAALRSSCPTRKSIRHFPKDRGPGWSGGRAIRLPRDGPAGRGRGRRRCWQLVRSGGPRSSSSRRADCISSRTSAPSLSSQRRRALSIGWPGRRRAEPAQTCAASVPRSSTRRSGLPSARRYSVSTSSCASS